MNNRLPPALEAHNHRQRQYFEGREKRTMVPTGTTYLRRHVDRMLDLAGISPQDRVLEVGCGMGRYTLLLAERGVRVEGLDLSGALLERLREFNGGRYRIPLYEADVVRYPQEIEGQFDVVLGFFTLHHLHNLALCFQAMARLLKPGGRVAFIEPNPLNPMYYIQMLVTPSMSWAGEKGIMRMRHPVVFAAMREANLHECRVSRFGFFPPFVVNRRWGTALETRLERVPAWHALLPFQYFSARHHG